jgi:hypothetical protein
MEQPPKQPLGRLSPVDLRDYWPDEAKAFTPWLAKPENLALLGEAIGIDLEWHQTEASVGPFAADMVCKNTADDSIVVIENQLEKTDHRHLGQILTYAAGKDAKTVIWVARSFTEQHREAVDWLNKNTNDDFEAFGVVIKLWRIGNSPPAPYFDVVAMPNHYSRASRERTRLGEPNSVSATYLDYWQGFCDNLENSGSTLRPQSPSTRQWMNMSIGRSGMHLAATASMRDGNVTAQLYFQGSGAPCYHQLLSQRAAIECELGEPPIWDHKDDRASCAIVYKRSGQTSDPTTWPELFRWTREKLELLDRVFRKRVAALPKLESIPSDGDE